MFTYDNPQKFIESLIRKMNFKKLDNDVLYDMEEALYDRLASRIIATMLSSFNEKDYDELSRLIDKEDMSTEDAFIMVAEKIPNIEEKVNKNVDDLFKELTQDFNNIDFNLQNI